jgi:hypothetical protein
VEEFKKQQRDINRKERLKSLEINRQLLDMNVKLEILEQVNLPFDPRRSSLGID